MNEQSFQKYRFFFLFFSFFNKGFSDPKLFRKQNPWILLSSIYIYIYIYFFFFFVQNKFSLQKCLQYKFLYIIKIMGFLVHIFSKRIIHETLKKKKKIPNSFFFHDYPPFTKKYFQNKTFFFKPCSQNKSWDFIKIIPFFLEKK